MFKDSSICYTNFLNFAEISLYYDLISGQIL